MRLRSLLCTMFTVYIVMCVFSSDVVVNGGNGANGVAEGGGKLFTTVDLTGSGEESPTTSESGESETHLAGTENGSCDRAQLGTEAGLEMVEFPEEEKRQKKPRRKPPVLTVSLGTVHFDTKVRSAAARHNEQCFTKSLKIGVCVWWCLLLDD